MLEGISAVNPIADLQGVQGMQAASASQRLRQMQTVLASPQMSAATIEDRQKVKEEFLAVFYKELLKQAFKPPKLGMGEDESSFMSTFGSDIMVEKMALELAQSGAFSARDLFPPEVGK